MRKNILNQIFIFIIVLSISACSSNSNEPNLISNSEVNGSNNPAVVNEIVEPSETSDNILVIEEFELHIPDYPPREPANPANLSFGLVSDNSQTMLVEAETGGTLTVEGLDGYTYSLEIPPGAIVNIAQITITPLSDIVGVPIEGPEAHGVLLEPEGLVFVTPATLTITPPSELGSEAVLGFGTFANGEDFHLLPRIVDEDYIQISVAHFSSLGIIENTKQAWNIEDYRSLVSSFTPNSSQAYYQNQIGQAFVQDEMDTRFPSILGEWFYEIVLPKLQNAVNTESLIDSAWFEMDAWLQAKSRLGTSEHNPGNNDFSNETAVAWRLLSRAYNNAFKEASNLCRNGDPEQAFRMLRWSKTISIITNLFEQYNLTGTQIYHNPDLSPADIEKWVGDCYRFKVYFNSKIISNDAAGAIHTQILKTDIVLFLKGDYNITTEVPFPYDQSNTFIDGLPAGFACQVTTTPGRVLVDLKVDANFSYRHEQAQKIVMEFYFRVKPTENFPCIPKILTLWHAGFSGTHRMVGYPQDAKLEMDIVRNAFAYATYIYTDVNPAGGTTDDEIYLIHTPN